MTDAIGYANSYRKERAMVWFVMNHQPLYDIYRDFPITAEIPVAEFGMGDPQVAPICDLAANLINEEVVRELLPALGKYKANPTLENLVEVADGGIDAIYVIMQLFHMLDLPFSMLFAEVHAANMAKLQRGEDGNLKRRADGKILKPEGWKAPEIFKILLEHSNTRAAQRANAEGEKQGAQTMADAYKMMGG